MTAYAAQTTVSVTKSRDEIEATLRRYGADEFAYATSATRASVGFVANGRRVRFDVAMPDRASREFTRSATGRARSDETANTEWEKACRQRWRALSLVIKAKLEAVRAGIVTFEEEFGMHMLLPNGRTVAEEVLPAVAIAYDTGVTPTLMIGAGS